VQDAVDEVKLSVIVDGKFADFRPHQHGIPKAVVSVE
jgi:hypothetical protein